MVRIGVPGVLYVAVLVAVAVCVAYSATAWFVGRRWGAAGLTLAWMTGTLVLTGVVAFRVHQAQVAAGVVAAPYLPVREILYPLPLWGAAFAAATLVLRHRLRRPESSYGLATATLSAAAFAAGAILAWLVFALIDLVQVVVGA